MIRNFASGGCIELDPTEQFYGIVQWGIASAFVFADIFSGHKRNLSRFNLVRSHLLLLGLLYIHPRRTVILLRPSRYSGWAVLCDWHMRSFLRWKRRAIK